MATDRLKKLFVEPPIDLEEDWDMGGEEIVATEPNEPLPEGRPITDYGYPDGDDPNVLLGTDDYLGRGGGFLFVSHAGAGKSSWVMDACMCWALGRPWMGIRCARPLRSLIIQAEDSDRYVGKVQASFAYANKLSPEDTKQMGENCKIVRLKGVSGVGFQKHLMRLAKLHTPDLVIINPLYMYANGDIGRSEFAQPFLLALDQANVEEKFAYILVHHTGKPTARGKDGKRATVDDWESVYQGFGSSYLANWPRCSALLEPVPGSHGRYQIKLGKGGFNAGVTKRVEQGAGWRDEPVTRIAIRHSTEKMPVGERDRPVYYWEMDPDGLEDESTTDNSTSAGRRTKCDWDEYKNLFPAHDTPGLPINQLSRRLMLNGKLSEAKIKSACVQWEKEGYVQIIDRPGEPRLFRKAK